MNTVKTPVYLSVVIPSFNEMANIRRGVVDEVLKYLKKQSYAWEIVFTDDGSTDGTLEELKKYERVDRTIRVLSNTHQGKGPTVYTGMMQAVGKFRLFTDFDQATPIQEIEELLPYAEQGYNVVFGSREMKGALREREPFYRHVMGKGWNMFVQLFALPGVYDSQCGFKLFSQQAVETLFPLLYVYRPLGLRADAYTGAFDVELLFLARKKKLKIKEVPVHWKHVRTNRVSPVKDSLRMLFDLLKMRVANAQGKYRRPQ